MAPGESGGSATAEPVGDLAGSERSPNSKLARQLLVISAVGLPTIVLSLLGVVAAADRMAWTYQFDGTIPREVPDTPQVYAALLGAIFCTATVLVVVLQHAFAVAAFTFRSKGAT